MNQKNSTVNLASNRAFWVVWFIELWERFGYYGVQAIIALYFVKQLGYSESQSFDVFGSFSAFVYGFIWVGGWIGDHYLGGKRTLLMGAIFLAFSYAALAISNKDDVFYALSGIVVGNALFKANPSALISKLYQKGDPQLDGAMTFYYMAVNIGAMVSMAITPFLARDIGWSVAYWVCALGLFVGIGNYFICRKYLNAIDTDAGRQTLCFKKIGLVCFGGVISILIIAQLFVYTATCNTIIYIVVALGFLYFLYLTCKQQPREQRRMIVAFVLMIQSIAFFVLYNQMPTSLTFFALHNIDNHFWGITLPAAEYQVLNSIVIIIMSPILAWAYIRWPGTHVTKYCIGMTLASMSYLVLYLPQFTAVSGIASPWWMVATYYFQSVSELLISGLGLAMVAELCPSNMTGFVMGIWWLTSMISGPIGAWVGDLTVVEHAKHFTAIDSMHVYTHAFLEIGIFTGVIAILMWGLRPFLNNLLEQQPSVKVVPVCLGEMS